MTFDAFLADLWPLVGAYVIPIVLMLVGVTIIVRPRRISHQMTWREQHRVRASARAVVASPPPPLDRRMAKRMRLWADIYALEDALSAGPDGFATIDHADAPTRGEVAAFRRQYPEALR